MMTEAFEEDCISDIRHRIISAIDLNKSLQIEKLISQVKGSREFFIKTYNKWTVLREFDRLQ
jgi:hypothetical protein